MARRDAPGPRQPPDAARRRAQGLQVENLGSPRRGRVASGSQLRPRKRGPGKAAVSPWRSHLASAPRRATPRVRSSSPASSTSRLGAATERNEPEDAPYLFWRVANRVSPGHRGPTVTVEVTNLERALICYHARPLRLAGGASGVRFFDEDVHDETVA